MPVTETTLIDERAMIRTDEEGKFDEFFLMEGSHCIVHAEMMDDGCLWIGFYPVGETKKRVSMWIRSKGRRLTVNAFED